MRESGDDSPAVGEPGAAGSAVVAAEPARSALPWLGTSGWTPALRLFCFPHAGGGAAVFRPWVSGDGRARIQICPVRPPGRETRWGEPVLGRVADLAEDFLRAAAPLLTTPFALLGNSLGSLVASEVARQVHERGLPAPVHLLVAASAAPGTDARRVQLSGLSDAKFAGELQRRYGGIPDTILNDPEHLEAYLPTLHGDVVAGETYRPDPEPRLTCPVTALVGVADSSVPVGSVDGWRTRTTGPFARHVLPGGHFAVLDHREFVLRILEADAPIRQNAHL
ncbi:thioesterase II family protein [Micromonospora sp. LH3U1]|uniref:thioesterase II family protein n=1 Tax=Micromonospora sp. LH3U1 TaxID=3018339 RepID=UPI00234ABB8F|nr:thioesterase domain-containing protein [Micromonospora sp. LH3U1]WCN79529.1 thioesterase domain-containing protein [Micromonospora sp. LH3U1]